MSLTITAIQQNMLEGKLSPLDAFTALDRKRSIVNSIIENTRKLESANEEITELQNRCTLISTLGICGAFSTGLNAKKMSKTSTIIALAATAALVALPQMIKYYIDPSAPIKTKLQSLWIELDGQTKHFEEEYSTRRNKLEAQVKSIEDAAKASGPKGAILVASLTFKRAFKNHRRNLI